MTAEAKGVTPAVIFNALLDSDVLDHINGILLKMSNSRRHVKVKFGEAVLCQRNLGFLVCKSNLQEEQQ